MALVRKRPRWSASIIGGGRRLGQLGYRTHLPSPRTGRRRERRVTAVAALDGEEAARSTEPLERIEQRRKSVEIVAHVGPENQVGRATPEPVGQSLDVAPAAPSQRVHSWPRRLIGRKVGLDVERRERQQPRKVSQHHTPSEAREEHPGRATSSSKLNGELPRGSTGARRHLQARVETATELVRCRPDLVGTHTAEEGVVTVGDDPKSGSKGRCAPVRALPECCLRTREPCRCGGLCPPGVRGKRQRVVVEDDGWHALAPARRAVERAALALCLARRHACSSRRRSVQRMCAWEIGGGGIVSVCEGVGVAARRCSRRRRVLGSPAPSAAPW
mmetsp:Transcript_43226/g.127098  ORF Transcript_43226/g.127098 Transcript_43226/m.127098 type:complete len:331 (-) Transcript_43226:195-1187(-)